MKEKIATALELVKSARMTYSTLEKTEGSTSAEFALASAIIDWREAQYRAVVQEEKVNNLIASYQAALKLVS